MLPARALVIGIIVSTLVGCDSSAMSLENRAKAAGCVETFKGSSDQHTIACRTEDGADLYVEDYSDGGLEHAIESLEEMRNDGTADKFYVRGEDWLIICFDRNLCEDLRTRFDGDLVQLQGS